MSQRLSNGGVDYFNYTVATNDVYSLTLDSGTVYDISNLIDVRLTALDISTTCVSDLSPLRKMRLRELSFDPNLATNGVDFIRQMDSLQKINGHAPDEFWAKYDAGAFNPPPAEEDFEWPSSSRHTTGSTSHFFDLYGFDPFKIQKYVDGLYEHSIKNLDL